ncbi:hypothetical protein PZ938_01400 [Luteipulveratus sp. YIM 133132]|uniref:hypothetical protein n=1 Tax=Luteipulveratus flavus TaxID=3031728 RepID=UPI0023B00DD4|nr:hypothetical protein [Luteipulveratus sp. YIM 133132]MDE9364250.1 hypothetical protein [Luteipulveratus sp. YIM 133132]
MRRRERLAAVHDLAHDQWGVVSRAQLLSRGIDRYDVRNELAAGRWRLLGARTVAVQSDLDPRASWWRAVWEAGEAARLDGSSALLAAGLRHWDEALLHVSVPRGSHARRVHGVRLHHVSGLEPASGSGVPRSRPEIAAVRAAQWATTDRQAMTVLVMSVQQRVVAPHRLADAWTQVTRSPRRRLLAEVDDALRDNHLLIAGTLTLRIPVLGLRLRPVEFMDQVETLVRRAQMQKERAV